MIRGQTQGQRLVQRQRHAIIQCQWGCCAISTPAHTGLSILVRKLISRGKTITRTHSKKDTLTETKKYTITMLASGAAVLFLHLLIPGFQYQAENFFLEEGQSHEDKHKDRDLFKSKDMQK